MDSDTTFNKIVALEDCKYDNNFIENALYYTTNYIRETNHKVNCRIK